MISHTTKKLMLVVGLIASTGTIHASLEEALRKEGFKILQSFVPRIGYTGLAIATGVAGICTSFYGYKHYTEGAIEGNDRKRSLGSQQMKIGAGLTASTIVAIYALWRRP